MTDRKISELTNITGADVDDANDELVIVDTSTSESRAITRKELFKDIDGNITLSGTVDGRDVAADGSKLDGIESNATADQTASEIKTAYESNADTNAFTDAEQTKLSNVETNADVTDTANVTAAGALMDSELTSEASVKALDQGVATTDSPDFAGLSVDTDTLYVDSANNRVGIGTSSPGFPLTVNSEDKLSIVARDTDSNDYYIGIGPDSLDGAAYITAGSGPASNDVDMVFRTTSNGTESEAMRIDSSGNVGIGTSSPVSVGSFIPTLDLKGQSNSRSGAVRFSSNDESSSGGLYFVKNQLNVSTFTADAILFKTNNSEAMRIDSSGNLLVGTTSAPTGASNSIVPSFDATGSNGIIGPSIINTQFETSVSSGTLTISLEGTFISVCLDVVIWGGFNDTNREGYAAYKVLCNRTTGSVTTITEQSPTNASGPFTSGFSFSASKPDADTLELAVTKPSGALYYVAVNGVIRRGDLSSVSSSFV